MSSRNQRLSPEQRDAAPCLFLALSETLAHLEALVIEGLALKEDGEGAGFYRLA